MKPIELGFNVDINITTYTMLLKGVTDKHGTAYFCTYSKRKVILYVTDNLSDKLPIRTIKNLLIQYAVVVVSPDVSCPMTHPHLVYINMPERLFNDETVVQMNNIEGIGSYGTVGWGVANLLSEKFRVKRFDNVETQLFKNENGILIRDHDGLGDILMLIPTIKTLAVRGFTIDIVTRYPECFQQLPYVDTVWEECKEVPKSTMYGRYYDITFKLSAYENQFCRQHRIGATAVLCGLKPEELVTNRPEIILTEQEIEIGKSFIAQGELRKKVALGLTSADSRRGYPKEQINSLVLTLKILLPNTDFFLLGQKERDMDLVDCIDLRGKTNIRELFACVNACDAVLCIDSSILHIAGALKKPTVLLPSTIPSEWRNYPETVSINPPVKCFPCQDRGKQCPNNITSGWCIGEIDRRIIAKKLKGCL